LPVDYLRVSGSSGSQGSQRSTFWYLNGVPYPMVPVDLAEFDMQVQQAGLQSYPWLWATDMSAPFTDRIVLTATGNTTVDSLSVVGLSNVTRLTAGLGIAGQGISPGSMIAAVDLPSFSLTLSQPAMQTVAGASFLIGSPPVGFTYPPPSAALQVVLRYQRQMPPIVDTSRYPWFTDDGYLIEKLTGRLCMLNDDSRADRLLGGPNVVGSPDNKLATWLAAKDDDVSRAKTVQMDRRVFGAIFPLLKDTKKVGW